MPKGKSSEPWDFWAKTVIGILVLLTLAMAAWAACTESHSYRVEPTTQPVLGAAPEART